MVGIDQESYHRNGYIPRYRKTALAKTKTKIIKVKTVDIKAPGPMRILCGSAAAYWLSGIISPGFVAIAVMILLFFPVFFIDFLFPEQPPIQDEKIEDGLIEDAEQAESDEFLE